MKVVVIGAGPAGLAATVELARNGAEVELLEAGEQVGGMARSFDLWGHRVDLGPHRFFSQDPEINQLWSEMLAGDYHTVSRCTRILFDGQLYRYPLEPLDILLRIGPARGALAVLSYLATWLRRSRPPADLEEWFIQRFGHYLYQVFFRGYSEKLWGRPCSEMDVDFAGQRVRGFSLQDVLRSFVLPAREATHRTVVSRFFYPRLGAGQLYERMAEIAISHGASLRLRARVTGFVCHAEGVKAVRTEGEAPLEADHVISSMPLSHLVQSLPCPDSVKEAARKLHFRTTFLVYLLLEGAHHFSDQWVYIQTTALQAGRITNFNNWGTDNSQRKTCVLCMEYWSSPGDSLARMPEADLKALAERELMATGLARGQVLAAEVLKVPRCYPVYLRGYKGPLAEIREGLRGFQNLSVIGRYGAFKYNNQDHSLAMGLRAAANLLRGAQHDLWELNSDYDQYQERGQSAP